MEKRKERTPADVAEAILQGSSYRALRDLKCRYRNGVLVVTGRVPTFFMKQLAQSAVVIELSPDLLQGQNTPLEIEVLGNGEHIETLKTTFLGPDKK